VPHVPAAHMTLMVDRKAAPALRVRTFAEGDEPLALALVISGQTIWMGNDEVETDPAARYPGMLHAIASAIDGLHLADVVPARSVGLVVSYSTGAAIQLPMAPIAQLTGQALGTQADYRGKLGDDMVDGISLALAELARSSAPHKALIVIGDGNDTNPDRAKAALLDLHKRALAAGVQVYSIVHKTLLSQEGVPVVSFAPSSVTINSGDGVAAALADIVARATDRLYVEFDAHGLSWDGRSHDLALLIDGHVVTDDSIVLPARARACQTCPRCVLQIVIGCVLVIGLVLLRRWQHARVAAASRNA